jgi:hypothetical protein
MVTRSVGMSRAGRVTGSSNIQDRDPNAVASTTGNEAPAKHPEVHW